MRDRGKTSDDDMNFHRQFLDLVAQIEADFPVHRWMCGDLHVWPLAKMDLYLEMYWIHVGGIAPPSRAFPLRAVARVATPLTNMWKSRRDLAHHLSRPHPAHAILLGDGVSLDLVDGAWQDRYGEPVIAALEKRGVDTFVMQSGALATLPWRRPTYAANRIAAGAALRRFAMRERCVLPDHDAVLHRLAVQGAPTESLSRQHIARRAGAVATTATMFERVLRVVRPRLAFVVTYYAGLGHAFLLACRRQGIFSVDLQHCPQEGAHKAYNWAALPEDGYGVLPAAFWTWTEREAAHIRTWADGLRLPWHRSIYAGHAQLDGFLSDDETVTRAWDAKFAAFDKGRFEREILVALQPVGGFRAQWDELQQEIDRAPPTWRWWIRRHPSARPYQDAEYQGLVSMRRSNVIVDDAMSLPLPALLRNMSVVVSRFSGAAAEAAAFGVPAFFLSDEARGQFSALIERGVAEVIRVQSLIERIRRLAGRPLRPPPIVTPDLDSTIGRLESMAHEYASLLHQTVKSA
jgi:hypothetical protein